MSGGAVGDSRLARMIERLVTQRACLAFAAARIADLPGPVLELGLGKGRTYDHLRRLLPGREIFAFDRDIHAPVDCVPDAAHLFLGEFAETLPAAAARLPAPAVLAHVDFGTEDRAADARLAARLGAALAALMRPAGMVLSDRPFEMIGWAALPLPADAGRWPYFIYRTAAPAA